jgi:hypothetical protein
MAGLRLLDKVDLSIYYDADRLQFDADWPVRNGVTRELFVETMKNCPSVGFEMDGVQFGGVLFDGHQAHLAVLPSFQGKWALLIRPALQWLLSLQDEIDVSVDQSNAKCIRFCDRNHWPRISENQLSVTFRICNHTDLFFNRREKKKASDSLR